MFAPKNFNLSEELINASRKVMEQKTQVVEEEMQLNEEEEALFEAFEEFLEENFYVEQLTEEEVEYLLDMFINEADEEKGTVGSRLDTAGWNKERRSNQAEVDRYLGPGVKAGSAEANMKLDTYNKERGTLGKVVDKISDAFSSYSPKSTSTAPAASASTASQEKSQTPYDKMQNQRNAIQSKVEAGNPQPEGRGTAVYNVNRAREGSIPKRGSTTGAVAGLQAELGGSSTKQGTQQDPNSTLQKNKPITNIEQPAPIKSKPQTQTSGTTQQARPQAPSMSTRKPSSSGSSSSEKFTGPKGRAGFGDSGSDFGG